MAMMHCAMHATMAMASAALPPFLLFEARIFDIALSARANETSSAPNESVPKEVVSARRMAPDVWCVSAAPFHHQSPTTLAAQKPPMLRMRTLPQK